MKRQRQEKGGDDNSSSSDGEGLPPRKYSLVEETNTFKVLSSDEEDYQTSDEDYEDFYDDPMYSSGVDDDDEGDDEELDDDEYISEEEDHAQTLLQQLIGMPMRVGNNDPLGFSFGGPLFSAGMPRFSMADFEARNFFLFSDGFIQNYEGDIEELKGMIKSHKGRVVSHAEAFMRAHLISCLNKRYCEQQEKYKHLLSLGEQKSAQEWSSLLTQEEISLLKTDPKSFGSSKFQMLNPSIILVCTEEEGRKATPLFSMVNSFTDFSDLPHSIIITESGLPVYFDQPESILHMREFHITNSIPLTKNYAVMAETPEKKAEIRKFLLENGAPNVIDNFLDPELVLDYSSFSVVVSDKVLQIIDTNPEQLDFEAITIGITSSFNNFYTYSDMVTSVKNLKTAIPYNTSFLNYRAKMLQATKDVILQHRKTTRKMIPEDQIPLQEFPSISPSERLSSIFPNEVFFSILKYLPVNEILNRFSITCKTARKMCFADHLWKDICMAYSSNYKFLKPFTNEENLVRTKLANYIIFRNIIHPILIDYNLVVKFITSKCAEEPHVFNIQEFNENLTTGLYMDRNATDDSLIEVGASKMFGSSDLPLCLHNTKYATIPLLLQLNLNDIREKGIGILSLENSAIRNLLPQTGVLYFLKNMASDRSDDGIVLHYDGDMSQLKRTNGEKLASSINFYEALCIPKRSEMVYSNSISLNGMLMTQQRDFMMDGTGIDDFFSQLIHAKFVREDITKLFGDLSCFTEGEWFGFRSRDEHEEEEEEHVSRCLDNYIDLKPILSPLFQLSGKYHMGRRMDATGFALLTSKERSAKWILLDSKIPNVYTLENYYCADFYQQLPSKFRKEHKHLLRHFKPANF